MLDSLVNQVDPISGLILPAFSRRGRREEEKRALRVGFEPTREDHIGFQVQRLNRSAIAA